MKKQVVYSGIQPSGSLTIGNYIGALSNFDALQDSYDCLYCIADLHAITVPQVPAELRQHTLDVLALYLACGLDPQRSIIYIQSQVKEHVELMWCLNTITGLGQLQRMTQYKDKAARTDEVTAGLLNYPVLMAADILLYQTSYVPVGEDQRQHIELTRDLAQRFNSRYSETFVVPEILPPRVGGRVMSLQDPTAKMSKSAADENSYILILDDAKAIERKIKRAVTDSLANFAYRPEQPGLRNLIDIYSAFSGDRPETIVARYRGQGYGGFKADLATLIIAGLKPVQDRFKEIRGDKSYLAEIYRDGAARASYLARKTMSKVYRKMGFVN